jgi:hypothetical protein
MTKAKECHVFVSYSHEGDAHKAWVRRLAEDLTRNGVKTTLDQWHLRAGDDIGAFMEQSLENAGHIILVCTETFAQKANERKGGVGYEQAVAVGNMLMSGELDSRLLPLLRSGEPSKALPRYLRSRLFIDFRDDNVYPQALEQLLRRVFEAPEFKPPELGEPPIFVKEAGGVDVRPENVSHRTATGAPHAWICVAGTGSRWRKIELDEKVKQTCISLGQSLARSGYGVVTGGWPGVDDLTSRSFARELEHLGIPLEDRLVQVIDENSLPAFLAGNLVLVPRGEKEWNESVRRADALVLIGGAGGTWIAGECGLKLGRAVFPLADTGGDAAKFYMHMQRHWKPEFLPGIDRRRFQAVGREAPQVVVELARLLDEWKHVRMHRA